MTHLNFSVPYFFRSMWTSDLARNQWEPRIRAIAAAISELQWRTVANDMRQCCIARVLSEQFEAKRHDFERHGLEVIPLSREVRGGPEYQSRVRPYVPGEPFQICVALGKHGAARDLAEAVRCESDDEAGTLLGYPGCCISSFLDDFRNSEYSDNTWSMARASVTGLSMLEDEGRTIRIDKASLANILLRGMGVRAVFHLPCRFDCSKSIECAEGVIRSGRGEGFRAEMEWLEEILNWPMEWNAMHGIAEIKTAVLKCSTSTAATAKAYRVLVMGTEFPELGAKGAGHVYHTSREALGRAALGPGRTGLPESTGKSGQSTSRRDSPDPL